MKTVPLRPTPERMEIEARDVEIAQYPGLFQRIESPKRPVLELSGHSSASAFAKQLLKPLVAEAPYHRRSVTDLVTSVNRPATRDSTEVSPLIWHPEPRPWLCAGVGRGCGFEAGSLSGNFDLDHCEPSG